ncbi:MAG: O-antigen translocase [Pseudomonadota bacterium]
MSESSYGRILRTSTIMGMVSVSNIFFGLLKMKAVALLLGPGGIGLVGLYQSLVQTGAQIATLGLGTVGTRQIAAAAADPEGDSVGSMRRVLFFAALGLSIVGGLFFIAASAPIAVYILQMPDRWRDVAWLSLGVALTVFTASQISVLTGLRRIGDVARVQVASGAAGLVFGIFAIWLWKEQGLLAVVLAGPLATVIVGYIYIRRLGPVRGPKPSITHVFGEWRALASLGIPIMLSGVVMAAGNLTARTLIQRELGVDQLGQFQAAWSIGMTYLAFVLGAMASDYFPRLSAVINDRETASRLVNEQTEVALILCGPILLATLSMAPWVVTLLYSADFGPAAEVLRWQVLGDILKVMSWPLGFVLLASGAGRAFIISETIGMGAFIATIALAMPFLGITATGVAFLVLYVVYLPIVWVFAHGRIGIRWSPAVRMQGVLLLSLAVLVYALVHYSPFWGGVGGIVISAGFAGVGLLQLVLHAPHGGMVGAVIKRMSWAHKRKTAK